MFSQKRNIKADVYCNSFRKQQRRGLFSAAFADTARAMALRVSWRDLVARRRGRVKRYCPVFQILCLE
jgi:hypothetical protein